MAELSYKEKITKRALDDKTQMIRLVGDVMILGPAMIAAGAIPSNLPPFVKFIMVTGGALTIVFNWNNYVRTEQIISKLKELKANEDKISESGQ